MSKSSRRRREPPHPAPEPAEGQESYSLEDILNEFGGWSRRESEAPEAEAPAPPAEPESAADAPEAAQTDDGPAGGDTPPEAPPAPPRRETPSRFRFVEMDLNAPKDPGAAAAPPSGAGVPASEEPAESAPEPERKIWTYRSERGPGAPAARRRAGADAPPEPRERPERRTERRKPEPVYPSAEEAFRAAGKRTGGLRLRRRLLALLTLLAVAVTCLRYFDVAPAGLALGDQLAAQILVGLLLAGALCAYDVLMGGVYDALRLRPGLDTLLTVATVVIAVDGFAHMGGRSVRLSAAAVALLGLFFALWGRVVANRARRRSLKAVLSMGEKPLAAALSRRAWGSRDCVFRCEGERERLVADLEAPGAVDRAMAVYAPAVILLTLALALTMHFMRQREFLTCWATMLAGSVPVAAFLTYWRPFAALTGRLYRAGAVLCGWRGARLLAGPCCVVAGDSDLFPKAAVSMNGMKMFGDYNVSQVVGYTYAVIAQSGCGLEPVFHEVFVNQNGRNYPLDSFRRYEGGGLGAEIQGDVVLVGSIGFMQLMGVQMPEGTNVRQAVYCAVNQKLAAVFAIHYTPSSAVRSGLQTVLRSRGLSLVLATRDFILTPAMIRHKYKVPSDVLEYPSVEERVRLSGPYAVVGSEQAGLLARDSFLPLAETVAGARGFYSSVWAGLCVNLLGGALGLAITVVLCWLGAFTAASPFNLMLFALLWTLPSLLLTTLAGK